MIYSLLKFLHIVAVIVWVGGLFTFWILNLRFASTNDRSIPLALHQQSEFLGRRVIGPAAGLTLLAGFATMGVGRLGFQLWVIWGIVVMVVSMGIAGTVLRRATTELGQRLANHDSTEQAIAAAQQRLATLSGINLLILLSAVLVMVAKPS